MAKAKTAKRKICARCEETLKDGDAVRSDFAPYAGMWLHPACLRRLEAETAGSHGEDT